MGREKVERNIRNACARLYREQKLYIDMHLNERTLVSYIVEYLRPLFPDLNVHSDYNREGSNGDIKRDAQGR